MAPWGKTHDRQSFGTIQEWWQSVPATPRRPKPLLPLLPSGPGGVHSFSSRGDRYGSPLTRLIRSRLLWRRATPYHIPARVREYPESRQSVPSPSPIFEAPRCLDSMYLRETALTAEIGKSTVEPRSSAVHGPSVGPALRLSARGRPDPASGDIWTPSAGQIDSAQCEWEWVLPLTAAQRQASSG